MKSDGAQKVWGKKGEAFTLSCIRGTVKFSGGNVMVWGSMAWNGTGKLEFIDGIMDSEVYVNILNKNLWAILDKKCGTRCLKRKEDLKIMLQEAWADIDSDTTKKLVESMPCRLAEVIKAKGGPTRY